MSHWGRMSRRAMLAGASASAAHRFFGARAVAQDEAPPDAFIDVPSTGGLRPGPIVRSRAVEGAGVNRGESPVHIRVPNAAIDAAIERLDIVDGVMVNPSGPWVVSWYHDLAMLRRNDNVVMAGHVDYWDVGPAVFWNLSQLAAGDLLEVDSEKGNTFSYGVAWMKNYVVAEMTPADFEEMLGNAGGEALTLITCTIGSWDEATQEYRERTVLRANQV